MTNLPDSTGEHFSAEEMALHVCWAKGHKQTPSVCVCVTSENVPTLCTHIFYVGENNYLDNVPLKWQWNTAPLTSHQDLVGQKKATKKHCMQQNCVALGATVAPGVLWPNLPARFEMLDNSSYETQTHTTL